MTVRRRLSIYDLISGHPVRLEREAVRYVFVADGECHLEAKDGSITMATGTGAPVPADAVLSARGSVWICETSIDDTPLQSHALAPVVLSTTVMVEGVSPQSLFRIDRIDLTAGAKTPRHLHRGPGIRRLLHGQVRVEIGEDVVGCGPGGAWFEPGDIPVVGENVFNGASAFLRVSLLPIDLIGGKSSFMPASDADAAKPRAVGQGLLHESVVAHI